MKNRRFVVGILAATAAALVAGCSSDESAGNAGSGTGDDATVGSDSGSADAGTDGTDGTADVSGGEDATEMGHPTLDPPAEGEGVQITMFGVAPAASEVWFCDVKPMPFPADSGFNAVKRVEVLQNPGTHHLTLSTLGLVPAGTLEHGRYDCNELYGDSSLMEDQIMFYGNQGTGEDTMLLPEGVAAKIPGGLDMIHEIHYVNPTFEDVELYSYINAYTVEDSGELEGIWGGSVRDEHINIPPGATDHKEWSRCVFNRDVEIHFLASHMHGRGKTFTIAPFDGTDVGDIIYTNDDWHVPKITQFDPPIIVPKGQGFEWACTWGNETDGMLNYGPTAEDEMCNMAVVHTPFDVTAACEVVETSDNVLWTP